MVWAQSRTSLNNRLPTLRLSPTRALTDNPCLECQSGTPPGVTHIPCLHHNDFAPTANRFSILAELNTCSGTEGSFDFAPTSTSVTKRRGKRGGKQKRRRHTLEKARKDPKLDGLEATCDVSETLHLDDSKPAVASQESSRRMSKGSTSLVDLVRHYWAPHFGPNSQPTSAPNEHSKVLQHQSLCPLLSLKLSNGPSIEVPLSDRNFHPRVPLSALLKDLASSNDYVKDWPPTSPSFEPASLQKIKSHIPSTYKRFSTSGLSPLSLCPASASTIPPTLTLPLAPTISTLPTFPNLSSSLAESANISPLTSRPFAASIIRPPASMIQQSVTTRPPHPPFASWGLHELSRGTTILRLPPSTLITAPVTSSPCPFVCPSRPRTLISVCQGLSKNTVAAPSMLRRSASGAPSSGIQKELGDFLGMGHADDCWCLSSNHAQCTAGTIMASTTINKPRPLPSPVTEELASAWHTPNTVVTVINSSESHNLPDLQADIESSFSESDDVLVTPSTESSWSVFGDQMKLDPDPQSIESKDDGWIEVSRHLQGKLPSSLSSRPASDTQDLTPDHVINPASAVKFFLLLPHTPLIPDYQATVSDNERDLEEGAFRSCVESPGLFAQVKRDNANLRPETVPKGAVPWPTLQEATTSEPTRKRPSRTWDDEWGGKV